MNGATRGSVLLPTGRDCLVNFCAVSFEQLPRLRSRLQSARKLEIALDIAIELRIEIFPQHSFLEQGNGSLTSSEKRSIDPTKLAALRFEWQTEKASIPNSWQAI